MKELVNYCSQIRRYGDSYGKCVVKLDDNETIQDVIKKYVEVKREWWEVEYSNPKEITAYIEKTYYGDFTYEGRLVIMDTFREYLD